MVPIGDGWANRSLWHLSEGLDEAAADRLEATFAAADVHAGVCIGHCAPL